MLLSRFGCAVEAWDMFAATLRRHAAEHDVLEIEATPFGTSYTVEGTSVASNGRAPRVRVVWFIQRGETTPRLVTAYPTKETGA